GKGREGKGKGKGSRDATMFETFWSAYPKKVGKDDAQRAFEKRNPDAETLGAMLAAITVQAASAQWQKDGGQYIPNPSTWLNQGRWKDQVSTPAPSGNDDWRPPELRALPEKTIEAERV
ncbi:MAG: hypothetical protein ACRDAM_15135, partial [Casimicrobium sp.]